MRTRTTPSTTEHHPQDLGTFPCAGSQPAWGCSPVSLLPPCAFTQRPRAGLATLRPGPALFCPPSLPKTRLPASPATPSSLLPARQPASAVCRRQVHTHTHCEKQTAMQPSSSAKTQIVHRWFRLQSGAGLDIIKSPYSSGSPVTACVIYRAQQLFQRAD